MHAEINTDAQLAAADIARQLDENGHFEAMDELFMPTWWIGAREAAKAVPLRTALEYMLHHAWIATDRYDHHRHCTIFVWEPRQEAP